MKTRCLLLAILCASCGSDSPGTDTNNSTNSQTNNPTSGDTNNAPANATTGETNSSTNTATNNTTNGGTNNPTNNLVNLPPSITISAPIDGSTLEDTRVAFAGSADDPEDGSLSASIGWSSSLEGELGTGATLMAELMAGEHEITATVTDSDGETASESIAITVDPFLFPSVKAGTFVTERGGFVAIAPDGSVFLAGDTTGVTGSTAQNLGGRDLFVTKFDRTGTQQWSSQRGTINDDYVDAIAAGPSGEVVLAGHLFADFETHTYLGFSDIFVTRYDANGQVDFTSFIATAAEEYPEGVAVASDGSIYVVGRSNGDLGGGTNGNMNAFVRKLSPAGDEIWTQQFQESGSSEFNGVTLDDAGAVYLSGRARGSLLGSPVPNGDGFADAILVKLAPQDGSVDWLRRFGTTSEDQLVRVAFQSGEITVIFSTQGAFVPNAAETPAFAMVKFDRAGNEIANSRAQYALAELILPRAVAVSPSGRIFASGVSYQGQGAYLFAFDANGAPEWQRILSTDNQSQGLGVALRANRVLFSGYTNQLIDGTQSIGDTDLFIEVLPETGP